jgi:hypothetical protein
MIVFVFDFSVQGGGGSVVEVVLLFVDDCPELGLGGYC